MPNYQNGKIYKLISDHTNKIYIGSTQLNYLSSRMSQHRDYYKNYKIGKFSYMTSFDIMEYGDTKIILLENYPCNSINELNARERYYIETMECVNKIIPGRTKKEYRSVRINMDRHNEQQRRYRSEKREKENRKRYQRKQPNLILPVDPPDYEIASLDT